MWLTDLFRRKPAPIEESTPVATERKSLPKMHVVGRSRSSVDGDDDISYSNLVLRAPDSYETNWTLLNLSSKDFDRLNPADLLDILADLSPEVSRGLWDFLRMANPGYEVKTTPPGSDQPDDTAKALIDVFIDRLSDYYGSFDIVLGRLFLAGFLRGALCSELVLDKRGRMPIDFATPDPNSVRFRQRQDPVRGTVWQPGQWQDYKFVPLDIPTFRYMPIDPKPGSPYGRPLASPALFISLFLLGMMHDLRRVIQQQGYPRLDIGIDLAQLLEIAPQIATDVTSFNEYVAALVQEVETVYSALEPDEAYIHTSNIMINKAIGTLDQVSLGGVDAVITALERMCVRALKTMPLMQGISENVGDVQSNRQWEIYIAGIKSIQHYAETMLERMFEMALQVQGVQANVTFRFAEVRDAERLRDAQAEAMEIANAKEKRDQGWISQDVASEAITGSPAVAEAPVTQTATAGIVQGSSDGMQLNSAALAQIRQAQRTVEDAMRVVSTNGYHAPN